MVNQLLDHYQIDAKIGEGQFANVYRGHDIRLGRPVALKLLKENNTFGSNAWGYVLREARIVSALNHPNVCNILDVGEDNERLFVVFELVEGCTLRAMLRSGPLRLPTVLHHGLAIADALKHAHSNGVIHRDLKPSNLMVTSQGEIKIIDFGIAKIVSKDQTLNARASHSSIIEQAGRLGGTLPYVAPEILHGEEATFQTDLWSLGVILYEMLEGHLPFLGRTTFELSMSIMVGRMEPMSRNIPHSLRGIVRRCLAKDRDIRYNSASQIHRHLGEELQRMDAASRCRVGCLSSVISALVSVIFAAR